jgi:triosephosphate isomerase
MHKTVEEAVSFVQQLLPNLKESNPKVSLAVPFTMIQALAKEAEGSPLIIGAQNMNDASQGAFTGEIAAKMLLDVGAQFVLLGHSERRHIFQEDNAFINRKLKRAIEDQLHPVLCIGETQKEHESTQTQDVLRQQITECLQDLQAEQLKNLTLAYEPVWAIGTGLSATPEIAQQAHAFCRQVLSEIFNADFANQIVIQYGGSVTPSNAKELLLQPDVDGLLIGGASLSLESFIKIIDDSNSILNSKVESI